jgi:hypothetical protein
MATDHGVGHKINRLYPLPKLHSTVCCAELPYRTLLTSLIYPAICVTFWGEIISKLQVQYNSLLFLFTAKIPSKIPTFQSQSSHLSVLFSYTPADHPYTSVLLTNGTQNGSRIAPSQERKDETACCGGQGPAATEECGWRMDTGLAWWCVLTSIGPVDGNRSHIAPPAGRLHHIYVQAHGR